MRRRWKILLCALCGLIAVLAIWFFGFREKEPSYNGRTLSEWLILHDHSLDIGDRGFVYTNRTAIAAAAAVRAIGSNAVPILLKWNRGQDSETLKATRTRFFELPRDYRYDWIRYLINHASPQRNQGLVTSGFEILGTNAVSALPELERAFIAATNHGEASRNAEAMQYLGPQALDFLLTFVQAGGPNNLHRIEAIKAIGQMHYLGTNAMPAVPVLLSIAQSTNDQFAHLAAWSAGRLGVAPEKVMSVLTNYVASTNDSNRFAGYYGLWFLSEHEPIPKDLVRQGLIDPKERVRVLVTNYAEKMAPDLVTNDPAYIQRKRARARQN